MIAMKGYFDGVSCVPFEKDKLKVNQKVIITALDDVEGHMPRRFGTLEGKGKAVFSEDWGLSVEEFLSL